MSKLIGKWFVGALFVAWLIAELVAAFDGSANTWPLTQELVTYLPPWVVIPAAVALALWIVPHFITNYRRRTATAAAPRLAASEASVPKFDLSKLARYNKLWVAVATAVLQAVQAEIPMSTTWHGWVTVALAGLGAAAVYAVPNKQPDPQPAPPVLAAPPKAS